ncbi:MAG: hypothetical protein RIQ47_241 [Bacteroidota bacterium]|jgi:hypothetical protein
MNESFLHYLWLHQHIRQVDLVTTSGETIEVLHPGTHNFHAGPDFFSARLRIGQTVWAGNVEIHLRSSDWNRHGHTEDPLYANCILHVVFEHDQDIFGVDGFTIPTLSLKGRFDDQLLFNYKALLEKDHVISCTAFLPAIHPVIKSSLLDRLTVERLEQRSNLMIRLLESTTGHWEESFYFALARNFGFHVNADPFERLARSVPLSALLRKREQLLSMEAILFGQAGFLSDSPADDYAIQLREEYLFQQRRLKLKPLINPGWKFLRMRPANFPTLRIAQFAMLLHANGPLLQRCMDINTIDEVCEIFRVGVSPYWRSHIRPDIPAPISDRYLGDEAIQLIIINTIIPFLFLRGRKTGDESLCEKMIYWLSILQPETNAIIRKWSAIGWKPDSAGEGQALLQLYENYCTPKKCINCSIGNQFILSGQSVVSEY